MGPEIGSFLIRKSTERLEEMAVTSEAQGEGGRKSFRLVPCFIPRGLGLGLTLKQNRAPKREEEGARNK